jgi:hypothetical protein
MRRPFEISSRSHFLAIRNDRFTQRRDIRSGATYAHDLQATRFYAIGVILGGGKGRARMPRDFVNSLRLSAALAALTLTASTACAAVTSLSDGLGRQVSTPVSRITK